LSWDRPSISSVMPVCGRWRPPTSSIVVPQDRQQQSLLTDMSGKTSRSGSHG
jgi:hypothetical protein